MSPSGLMEVAMFVIGIVLVLQTLSAGSIQAVSLLEPAAPLKRLMPRLAEACHAAIRVSPAMADEIVCLDVHEVATDELLSRIALATAGKWLSQGDVQWLVPDTDARAALTKRGLDVRIAETQKHLDRLVAKLHKEPSKPGPGDVFSRQRMASERLISQILNAIGALEITAVPVGGRVVFSTSPPARQRWLPASCAEYISAYISSGNANWGQMQAQVQAINMKNGFPPVDLTDAPPRSPVEQEFSKFDVILGRDSTMGERAGVSATFVLYDGKGEEISYGDGLEMPQFLNDGYGEFLNPDDFDDHANPKPPPFSKQGLEAESVIKLSKVAERILNGEAASPLPGPDKGDPLSYPAELLFGTAKRRHVQLVASLPDRFFGWGEEQMEGPTERSAMRPSNVLKALRDSPDLSTTLTGHWLMVSPTDFRFKPVNREKLAALADKYVGKTDVALSDIFELARAGYGEPIGSSVLNAWMNLVCPLLLGFRDEDWGLVKICGTLSPDEFQSLQTGSAHAAAFGSDALALADAYVSADGLRVEEDPGAKSRLSGVAYFEDGDGGYKPPDVRAEPTEVLPSGLTGAEPIKLKVESKMIMRPGGKYLGSAAGWDLCGLTADEFGAQSAEINWDQNGSHVVSVDYDKEEERFKGVQVGARLTYRVRIYCRAGSYRAGSFFVPVFSSAETYTLKTLPGNLQKQFDTAVEAAKKEASKFQERTKP